MEEFDTGAHLRQCRLEKGMSQRQLAEAAGVPHGQISMIETNRSSPSIASLRRILRGLDMSMAEFFGPTTPKGRQVFFAAADQRDVTPRVLARMAGAGSTDPVAPQGRFRVAQIGDEAAHGLQILREVYDPGAERSAAALPQAVAIGGIVVSGEIEVTIGHQCRILAAGDGYMFDAALPHRFRNLTDRPAEIVSACTPPCL